MSTTQGAFEWTNAPMARDRTAGWAAFLEQGEVFQSADGLWFVTSPTMIRAATSQPLIFSSVGSTAQLQAPVPLIPVEFDPPEHKRFRRILDPMLAPRVVDAMVDSLRGQARELIEKFAHRGHCDVVTELARQYPTQVFLTLFGMPLEDRDQMIEWIQTIIHNAQPDPTAEPDPQLAAASAALIDYLRGHIDKKRSAPADDMLSKVVGLTDEDAWTDEEVLGLCFLFSLAGLDTVTNAISLSFLHLARRPDLQQQIGRDSNSVVPIMEELLRLEHPAPISPRVTTTDVELGGKRIPAGSTVVLLWGAANRAGDRRCPNDIDLETFDQPHMTFGSGIHRCLGSHLARRELRLIMEEFHRLIPSYSLADNEVPEVAWPSGDLHLSSLELVFTPA